MGLILGRRSGRRRPIRFTELVTEPDDLITYPGDSHLITFAPTGTGKTSGPVICDAPTHPGQLIVLDIRARFVRQQPTRAGRWGKASTCSTCGMAGKRIRSTLSVIKTEDVSCRSRKASGSLESRMRDQHEGLRVLAALRSEYMFERYPRIARKVESEIGRC
jgi:hypothetical protein